MNRSLVLEPALLVDRPSNCPVCEVEQDIYRDIAVKMFGQPATPEAYRETRRAAQTAVFSHLYGRA